MLPEDLGITAELMDSSIELRALASVALILAVLLTRWLIVHEIRRRAGILTDVQRWWITTVRNIATGSILIGLIAIWATELADFALSITAFAVALVFATKELLLCFSGAAWRGTTLAFRVGDWVEIGEHSGEVIDETLLATVLQEIDLRELRYTGRTIHVPNAMLFSNQVVNHNFRKRFLMHEFTLTALPGADPLKVQQAMLRTLRAEADTFTDLAQRYAQVIEKRAGVKLPDLEPRVALGTTDLGNVTYRASLFCPRERAAEIEQTATAVFMREMARAGVPAGVAVGAAPAAAQS